MIGMRGYVFTLTTFLIFLGIIAYFNAYVSAARDRTELINEQVASERIWHSWRSAASGMISVTNISVAKWAPDVAEINDTLPAPTSVINLLGRWQEFVRAYYSDSSMTVRFEDDSGNEVDLGGTTPKVSIMPMGLNYSWPDWSKRESNLVVDGTSLPFIERITLNIRVAQEITNDTTIQWTPEQTCGITAPHCLNLTLSITDGNLAYTTVNTLDVDQQSRIRIDLVSPSWIRVTVGSLPNLLRVDMQEANATTNTRIDLNTTEFYNSFLARLSVRTPFGQKVAPISS